MKINENAQLLLHPQKNQFMKNILTNVKNFIYKKLFLLTYSILFYIHTNIHIFCHMGTCIVSFQLNFFMFS